MKIPAHIQKAIQAYYAERSTPEDVAALEDWFREDDAHIKIFAEHGMVEWQMLCEHEKQDAAAILHTLHETEVEPALSLLDLPFSFPPAAEVDPSNPGSLSTQDYIKAARYALHLVFTSKPAKKFYGRVAVAATLLLAVTLLVVFTRDAPNDLNDTVADLDFWDDTDTSTPPAVAPETTAVATLTAEHNAQWGSTPAERALARGSALHPNQRLTLTAGFAEITTNDGAIAILQAPATIEFTDHDNALRLHAGKLVGICETDSSKGFLVQTPHMDITDLGTRFGINADADATKVHVFEGEVQAERVDAAFGTQPMRLVANQSARTSADTDVIASIDHAVEPFAALLPTTIQLPGTGVGLNVGDADPNWQIVAIDGQPLDTPQTLRVARDGIYIEHFANDPATSQFVAWNPGVEPPVGGAIAYTFRTLIDVPEDIDPANARLVMRYMADNKVQAVVINGNRVEIDGHAFDLAYDRWAHCVIDEHLVTGSNTILFEIHNRRPDELPTRNVGLRLQWELLSKPEALQEINSQP